MSTALVQGRVGPRRMGAATGRGRQLPKGRFNKGAASWRQGRVENTEHTALMGEDGLNGGAREHDEQLQRRPGPWAGPPRSFQSLRPRATAPTPPSAPPSTPEEEVPPQTGPQAAGAERGRLPQAPSPFSVRPPPESSLSAVQPSPGPTLGPLRPRPARKGATPRPMCLPHSLGFREDRVPPAGFRVWPDAALRPPQAPHPVRCPAKPQRVRVRRAQPACRAQGAGSAAKQPQMASGPRVGQPPGREEAGAAAQPPRAS